MKINHTLFSLSLIGLTACSTMKLDHNNSAKSDPETVMVTYRVKPGREAEFQQTLAQAWEIYRKEPLVFAEPHVVIRSTENGGKTRFVEVFTWVSHSGPERAPESVKTIWEREQSLCEARGSHPGIEGGEVDLLVPSPK